MFHTLLAWLVFLAGFGIEVGVDRFLRVRDGDVTTGGIPEPLWFAIPMVLAAAATVLAWQGTRPLHAIWKRLAVLSIQLLAGFAIYAAGCLWYRVGSGIDSL
jgi:nicotinamide riboside transporter PnuC